ncbi:beta-propeller fold lactonase family protein, partial [Klebsiella pneumoniae]|uniref:beta-propeller fold lactonase family protein n=1 Tax=Klebsiella pneumoniae TaxID=573 RepID=UPI002731555F
EQLVLNGTGQVSQLNGIADVVVSPDGSHVYAVSSLDSAIVAFERNLQSGHLDWLATYSNNSSGIVGLSGARSLVIDSSGRHLYAAGTNANAV